MIQISFQSIFSSILLVALLAGCPGKKTSDADERRAPAARVVTAGGGYAKSQKYQVQLRVGAPTPMGTVRSTKTRARTGPRND